MPVLLVLMVIITLRGVTLEGATTGLNALLTPDFGALMDPNVWVAAYGQVFFSLSVGFATMITYASYLKKTDDLANSGLICALANSGFEFMAALGVFGALGFLAVQSGVDVQEVVGGGIGLAFIVFPKIISQLPWLNSLFGVIFFGTLVIAGLTSIVSLVEPVVSAVRDKLGLARTTAVNWICGISFLISILYATKGGINYLDLVDHFVNTYGLLFGTILMTLVTAWFTRKVGDLQNHINEVSDVHIGNWWIFCVKYMTPVMLIIITGVHIWEEWLAPYGGFPQSAIWGMGWGALLAALITGIIFQRIEWKTIDQSLRDKEGA